MKEGIKISDFNAFLKRKQDGKKLIKQIIEGTPPPNTWEIGIDYEFDKGGAKSYAYYDEARTANNFIREATFKTGKCIKYLGQTKLGPMFLFKGKLSDEGQPIEKGIDVFFGMIHNKTDPNRVTATRIDTE